MFSQPNEKNIIELPFLLVAFIRKNIKNKKNDLNWQAENVKSWRVFVAHLLQQSESLGVDVYV